MANNQSRWNIYPLHQNFGSFGSSSAHTSLVNYFNSSAQAFTTMTAFSSSSGHTLLRGSGYQYVSVNTTLLTTSWTETAGADDSTFNKNFSELITETITSFDGVNHGITAWEEDVPVLDQWLVNYTPIINEGLSVLDNFTVEKLFEEDVLILDQFTTKITTFITETVGVNDLAQGVYLFNPIAGIKVEILEPVAQKASTKVTIDAYLEGEYAPINVGIRQFDLSPVTSISAQPTPSTNPPAVGVAQYQVTNYPSPIDITSNPFAPTVILGGTTYASDPSTSPPASTVGSNTYFVQWLNASIGDINTCTIMNYDMSLDPIGGTFSVVSSGTPTGTTDYTQILGNSINVFGFNGTITGFGEVYSNSNFGYLTSGIFGNRNLNKQLNELAGGNNLVYKFLTNSVFQNAVDLNQNLNQQTQQATITTFQGAAQAVATMAQINLQYNIPDFQLIDLTLQEAETAGSALQQIAAQFGATVRWNGGNNYEICYPNVYAGEFTVPDKSLITAAGTEYHQLLDIGTGAYGTGYFGIPVDSYFNPSGLNSPNLDATANIQPIGGTITTFSADQPPLYIPCPLDAQAAWIQILVSPANDTNPLSGSLLSQNLAGDPLPAGFSPSNFVTSNPTQWYNIGSPSISNPYFTFNANGQLFVKVDSTVMPPAASINAGKFTLRVGITRNTLADNFLQAFNYRNALLQLALAKLQGQFTYVKTYEGTINCFFFGAIPLPGMYASATSCGLPVQGIIQSVSFTYPGILNIQVAQFAHVDFIKNFYTINLLNLNNPGSINPGNGIST